MIENSPDERTRKSLAELRAAMSELDAPAEVRSAVLRDYATVVRRKARVRVPLAAWAAIAASVLLFAYGLYRRIDRNPGTQPPEQAMLKRPVQKTLEVGGVPLDTPKQRAHVRRPAKRRPRQPHTVAAQPVQEVRNSGDFVALPSAPPIDPAEGGAIVRVTLPRSAMRSFGIVVDDTDPPGRVTADVMLGSDGVARAVRFVSFRSR